MLTCVALVDGELVESIKIHEGNVTFSTTSGQHFQIQFECAQILGKGESKPLFSGEVWLTRHEDGKSSISGQKCYLWGDVLNSKFNNKDVIPPTRLEIANEKLSAAADTREDAALDLLAVSLDLITSQYTPSMVFLLAGIEKGDMYLEGVHVILTVGAAALGAFLTGGSNPVGGAAAGAAGAQASHLLTAVFKQRYLTKQKRKLRNFVSSYKVDLTDLLTDKVERDVNGLRLKDLEDEGIVVELRKEVGREYALYATNIMRQRVYQKFRKLHHLWKDNFLEAFKDSISKKFETEVSKLYLSNVIKSYIKKRLTGRDLQDLPKEIKRLQKQWRDLKEKKERELDQVKCLPQKHQEEERKKIKEKYAENLADMQQELKSKNERLKDAKDADSQKNIKKRLEDIKREAEVHRQREREAQEALQQPKREARV